MGCLILILIVAGIVTLPSIFGPLIFWSLAAVIYWQGQSKTQQAQQHREQTRQTRELIKAVNPQAYQELVDKEAAEEVETRKRHLIAWAVVIGLCVIVGAFNGLTHCGSGPTETTSTVSPTPTTGTVTAYDTTPVPKSAASVASWATPTPQIKQTPSVESDYIPDPTEEQATEAFNDLQDQLHRPHVTKVIYTASTDSYNWTGPKSGKKMSIKRSEFDAEIWNNYYKKLKGYTTPTPTPEIAATPVASPTAVGVGLLKSRVVKWTPEATEEFNDASAKEIAAVKKAIATIHWSRKADPEEAADEDFDTIAKYCAGKDDVETDVIAIALENVFPGGDTASAAYFSRMNDNLLGRAQARHSQAEKKATPTPDASSEATPEANPTAPAPTSIWTKEDEYRVFGKGQLKYNNPSNTGINPTDLRLAPRAGESVLREGARWAATEQGVKDQDWEGTAFRELPIKVIRDNWGVIEFHFRRSLDDNLTFYTSSNWVIRDPYQRAAGDK
jgi:hypothetical protein